MDGEKNNNKNTMDNKAFKEANTGTELIKVTVNGASTSTAKATTGQQLRAATTTTCTPEVCRLARQRYNTPDLSSDSPWNKKKTYLFVGTIVAFVIWIVVYSTVSELKLV